MWSKHLTRSCGVYDERKKTKQNVDYLYRKLYNLLLLNVIDYTFSTPCLLPIPNPTVFLYPRDCKWRHTVLARRHVSCRHMLKKHARVSKEAFILFPHCPFTPTLWISLFPLPDEVQFPQIFCSLSVTRCVSLQKSKCPTYSVIIRTTFFFQVKHFPASPSHPQAQTCFRLEFPSSTTL